MITCHICGLEAAPDAFDSRPGCQRAGCGLNAPAAISARCRALAIEADRWTYMEGTKVERLVMRRERQVQAAERKARHLRRKAREASARLAAHESAGSAIP